MLYAQLGRPEDYNKAIESMTHTIRLIPAGDPNVIIYLQALGCIYLRLFERSGRTEDLEKSIVYWEQVAPKISNDHPHRNALLHDLGCSYLRLFERLGRLEDLDKSINIQESMVFLIPDNDPNKPSSLCSLGAAYARLFQRLGRQEDLEKSNIYIKQAVVLTPDDHPLKRRLLHNLGLSYNQLFEHLHRTDDIENSIRCITQALALTPNDHPEYPVSLMVLGTAYKLSWDYFEIPTCFAKAIGCFQKAVLLLPDSHPIKPECLGNLGNIYQGFVNLSGRQEEAKLATHYLHWALQLWPADHPQRSISMAGLGKLYSGVFKHSNLPEHGLDAMNFYKTAGLIPTGYPTLRLQASHLWARYASLLDEDPVGAYGHFMKLLPQVVWLGTSVHHRYKQLTRSIQQAVTEAASVAVAVNQRGLALEWLEQGRSIVWGQMLNLRTPIDKLYSADPTLAEELRWVSQEIESASSFQPIKTTFNQDGTSSHESEQRHRRLVERREELLELARQLPGLSEFLSPLKCSKLAAFVQDGVVVMVNVDVTRCDALIMQAGTEAITNVPLTGFSARKADEARDELMSCLRSVGIRRGVKKGDTAQKPSFKKILAMLWHDVVKPVLDHLRITWTPVPGVLPHITWCTTGALSFLPLHAAGDYNDTGTILSNLAVSSYIPTISLLGQYASPPDSFSGTLAVGHSSSIRGLTPLPGTKAELDQVETHAGGLKFTRLGEEYARKDSVLQAMGDHSWVHFACHGSQNSLDPLNSALHLYDEDLDLATIARTPLKNAQLAFLSACQTAAGDSALPDESVHLAAGLLTAGYPTVIATMWSIHDKDAPLVAGKFYECLLENGVPDSRKAAVGLHNAVKELREKVGVDEFARWVPYIHLGR
ncbi:hypothetical protein FRC07_002467 [Ceratobasidium sp. 392]|nr:hypothetical protein FRC07_002467 [Ceratobasidium sp. 392]